MTDVRQSRRAFLASVGAVSAAGLVPREEAAATGVAAQGGDARVGRGIALAPDDVAFAPGLVYLQTGSLGPTPRPVMERAVAAWKQLQLNPSAFGYGELEQAMEAVRAKAAAFAVAGSRSVLTNCTTEGMNWTAQGLRLAAGDRVLTGGQVAEGSSRIVPASMASIRRSISTFHELGREFLGGRGELCSFCPAAIRT